MAPDDTHTHNPSMPHPDVAATTGSAKASASTVVANASLVDDDAEDKLSDYIPQSGEVSRAATASANVSRFPSRSPPTDKTAVKTADRFVTGKGTKKEDDEGEEQQQQDEEDKKDLDEAAEATDDNGNENDYDDGDSDGDGDGDVSMQSAQSPNKTSRQLEREREKVERSAARKDAQEKRAARATDLGLTRERQQGRKLTDSLKRFSYLLGQTELFQHFIDVKKHRDPEFAQLLEESQARQK